MNAAKAKQGFTLIEAIIASGLIAVVVLIIYGEMLQTYRVLYYARAQMIAQEIAFDKLWYYFNMDYDSLTESKIITGKTPADSMFSTNGVVRTAIVAYPTYSELRVQVWNPPQNAITTNALVDYTIRRFSGNRGNE